MAGGLTLAPEAKACRGALQPMHNAARSHDKKRTRRARLRQRSVRNSSPYLAEIPIVAGCPGGTTGSPS